MIRTTVVSLVSVIMITLVCHAFGQLGTDIPVQTFYKEYRLLTVPVSNDGPGNAVPAATAVPEPKSWIYLALGGALIAFAGLRRSASPKRSVRN